MYIITKYLKKQNKELENTGDITVPQGTKVKWFFSTENTDDVIFIETDSNNFLEKSAEDEFVFERRFLRSSEYGLSVANKNLQFLDTILYVVNVIPDAPPSIEVDTRVDSLNQQIRYFKGLVKDDYGFSQLLFYRRFVSKNDSVGTFEKQSIPINLALPTTDFYHSLNLDSYLLAAGDEIEYYFEVWDNDEFFFVSWLRMLRKRKYTMSKHKIAYKREKDLVKLFNRMQKKVL